jgi:hypothetical protein
MPHAAGFVSVCYVIVIERYVNIYIHFDLLHNNFDKR